MLGSYPRGRWCKSIQRNHTMPHKSLRILISTHLSLGGAPIRTSQAKKKGEFKICELDEQIVNEEMKIQEICAEYPLDFDKLMQAQDQLALVERRKKQLSKIIKELFEEE